MARRTVTVSLNDDELAWVERNGNRSSYVRDLIARDMAQSESATEPAAAEPQPEEPTDTDDESAATVEPRRLDWTRCFPG